MERYKSIYNEDVFNLKEGVVDKKVFDILKSLGVSLTERNFSSVNTLYKKRDRYANSYVDNFIKKESNKDKGSLGDFIAYVLCLKDKIPFNSNTAFKYRMDMKQKFESSNLTDEQISFIKSEISKLINVW